MKKIVLIGCLLSLLWTLLDGQDTESPEEVMKILNEEFPAEIQKRFSYFLSGYDEDGTPVWILEFGRWDLRGFVEDVTGGEYSKDLERYVTQMYARWSYPQYMNLKGNPKDFIVILDLNGYTNRQLGHLAAVRQYINGAGQYAPVVARRKNMKKTIFVNTNYVFQTAWNLAKPVVGSLFSDIQLYGTNPEKWKPVLLKLVPKDQLPECLGGLAGHKPLLQFGQPYTPICTK